MQVNSSSNTSLLSPHHCVINSSHYPLVFTCSESPISAAVLLALSSTNLFFFLPLYILIIWMGFQQWRGSGTVGTASHSDVFNCFMVTLEIIAISGWTFYCIAIYTCHVGIMTVGYYLLSFTYSGQTFFHCLTCVERYLAVVHPFTYLGLKTAAGIWIRNVIIGCVFLLCFGMTGLAAVDFPDFPIYIMLSIVTFNLIVVSFCSFSALCVLIRLGLGKVGGFRERIDQSKQRAFYTIMAIMVTLLLRFCGLLVTCFMFLPGSGPHGCLLIMSGSWLCMPSSLVLPLMFLHRAGTIPCLSRNLNQREN